MKKYINNKPSQQLPETAGPESKIRCWVPFCSMEVFSILIGWHMKDFKHETTTHHIEPQGHTHLLDTLGACRGLMSSRPSYPCCNHRNIILLPKPGWALQAPPLEGLPTSSDLECFTSTHLE